MRVFLKGRVCHAERNNSLREAKRIVESKHPYLHDELLPYLAVAAAAFVGCANLSRRSAKDIISSLYFVLQWEDNRRLARR
jgi:hypothetical protein